MKATLHTDGGARGNPGPAGIGYVLQIETTGASRLITHGEFIGEATNNAAEYEALEQGLVRAHAEGVRALSCFLDSELVVKQLNGEYRVKHPDLKPRFARAQEQAKRFDKISFAHVRREKNKLADKLVNQAIDAAV